MSVNLPNFPEFKLHPRETAHTRFEKYLKRLDNLFAAINITRTAQKKAILLHFVGEETCDVFDTLDTPDSSDDVDEYQIAVKALKDYFEPQKCIDHHVYVFRKEVQKVDESVAEFYTRLQLLARKCEFANADVEIKRQIIQGTSSVRLRRKAIEQSLTLENLLKAARAMETADEQTSEIEKQQSNAISSGRNRFRSKATEKRKPNQSRPELKAKKCGLCGGHFPHQGNCPAQGKRCHNCNKLNHFAKVCRSKLRDQSKNTGQNSSRAKQYARAVDDIDLLGAASTTITRESDESTDSEEYIFRIEECDQVASKPMFEVKISNTPIYIMADSGATVNILSKKDYNSLEPKPKLSNTFTQVFPYMSNKPLELQGNFKAKVTSANGASEEVFYVANGSSNSILSWEASQRLSLIKIVNNVGETSVDLPPGAPKFIKKYPSVINGTGKCKTEPVRIYVDESQKPVAQPHRRIPFLVRKLVEEQLEQLEENDIIERAEGPTPWVSPIVVVPKPRNPNEIRICVDMRNLNNAIIRERHIIPTIDDVTSDLNGCKVFSKIDLNQGYHQIPLHPQSRPLTTFSTHVGLFRYKRLNFGLSCAAEVFQKKISDVIQGISGVRNISDDIYVGGATMEEHDRRLEQVLRQLDGNGLTINLAKCVFRAPSMLFFGHVFSGEGISPDPKKVEALRNAAPPTNVTEVRSLLSSAAFCSRFIKDFAMITKPLRQLTCDGAKWQWTAIEQSSFERLQAALSTKTTLGYFDPNKPTYIFVDGSPVGLGAVLTQMNESTKEVIPLYYASCPLTPTQARYPQIDREALSIYWAIKRFHLFVYGKEFNVVTDHKPLVTLFNNPSSRPSARIERWLMELQQYRFTVEYKPGQSNPADYASRHPVGDPESQAFESEAEEHVQFVAKHAVPKAINLADIEQATMSDPTLQAVISAVKSGGWHKAPSQVSLSELSRYEKVKEQLTCTDTVLLKADRLVIPAQLQEQIVDIAHEGHLGIVKTKALLREKVWFPCMDKMVEDKIKACLACQIATPVYSREPLKMTQLPDGPFEEVSVDFAYVDGQNLLLVVDDYSRFPFVESVSSTSASAVIPKLDSIFATFGIPRVVKSDNGPPFNGEEFSKFSRVVGFKHRKVTPFWPRANGEVERLVKTLKKCLKAAKSEGTNWRKALQSFLRSYRSTPHLTTGVAPSVLLLGRATRNKLPQIKSLDPVAEIIRRKDSSQKQKIKAYADNKSYVTPCTIRPGESVLVKKSYTASKSDLPYNSTPMTVVSKKGSMITAQGDGQPQITRNSSFFKKLVLKPNVLAEREPSVPTEVGQSISSPTHVTPAKSPDGPAVPAAQNTNGPLGPPQISDGGTVPPLRRSSRIRRPRNILDL